MTEKTSHPSRLMVVVDVGRIRSAAKNASVLLIEEPLSGSLAVPAVLSELAHAGETVRPSPISTSQRSNRELIDRLSCQTFGASFFCSTLGTALGSGPVPLSAGRAVSPSSWTSGLLGETQDSMAVHAGVVDAADSPVLDVPPLVGTTFNRTQVHETDFTGPSQQRQAAQNAAVS